MEKKVAVSVLPSGKFTTVLYGLAVGLILSLIAPFTVRYTIDQLGLVWTSSYGSIIYSLVVYMGELLIGLIVLFLMIGPSTEGFYLKGKLEAHAYKWLVPFIGAWLILVVGFYKIAYTLHPDFPSYISGWWLKDLHALKLSLISTCFLAPIFEEIFFRGIIAYLLLKAMRTTYKDLSRGKKILLILFNGLIFSLAHVSYLVNPIRILPLDSVQLMTTFVIGCLLTHVYYKYKDIRSAMLGHMTANIIQVLTGYYYAFFVLH